MKQVIADEALRSRLFNLREEVEVRDEAGHVLGHYQPIQRLMTYDELKDLPVH